MKGVSTIIATILMLVIVISMSAFAFTYMTGIFTRETAVVLSVDDMTSCSGTSITVMIDNSGTSSVDATKVWLSGTNAAGGAITGAYCNTTAGATISAGSTYQCSSTLTGTGGFNTVKVKDPTGRTRSAAIQCTG